MDSDLKTHDGNADPLIGKTIDGSFKILSRLGHGGMGSVYRALQLTTNRKIALKIINQGELTELDLERFHREAQILSNLEHSNISKIYSVGKTPDGSPYFTMELVEGRSLADILKEKTRLSQEETRKLAVQVARALVLIHSKGIIHRDVKPSNIVIENGPDESPRACLVDFGVARPTTTDGARTQSGQLTGTPQYMSPEQCRGEPVSSASDIYSLGCSLFEMLTGSQPFTGQTAGEILHSHLTAEAPAFPATLAIAKSWQQLVFSCLSKTAGQRPEAEKVERFLNLLETTEGQRLVERELRNVELPEDFHVQALKRGTVRTTSVMCLTGVIFILASLFFSQPQSIPVLSAIEKFEVKMLGTHNPERALTLWWIGTLTSDGVKEPGRKLKILNEAIEAFLPQGVALPDELQRKSPKKDLFDSKLEDPTDLPLAASKIPDNLWIDRATALAACASKLDSSTVLPLVVQQMLAACDSGSESTRRKLAILSCDAVRSMRDLPDAKGEIATQQRIEIIRQYDLCLWILIKVNSITPNSGNVFFEKWIRAWLKTPPSLVSMMGCSAVWKLDAKGLTGYSETILSRLKQILGALHSSNPKEAEIMEQSFLQCFITPSTSTPETARLVPVLSVVSGKSIREFPHSEKFAWRASDIAAWLKTNHIQGNYAILEQSLLSASPTIAASCFALEGCSLAPGNRAEAEALWQKVREIADSKNNDKDHYLLLLRSAAELGVLLDHNEEAMDYLLEHEKLRGGGHRLRKVLFRLARHTEARGRISEAVRLYERAAGTKDPKDNKNILLSRIEKRLMQAQAKLKEYPSGIGPADAETSNTYVSPNSNEDDDEIDL